jgi:hypothetical protein
MSKDITSLLKEATKDLLTDETLKAITEAFEKKVEEKVSLAVEAALVKQDEEYSVKLEKVLEAIDADHTSKLEKIVSRIDENHAIKFEHAFKTIDTVHARKLQVLVNRYEKALKNEADTFKNTVVENVSNYLELYLDKTIPAKQIQEATENVRSRKIIDEIKRLVSLDETFVNGQIKEALIDGKRQIDEANAKAVEASKQAKLLTEQLNTAQKNLLLEKKIANLPAPKKAYMLRVLAEKDASFINENFEYVSEMYEKKEEETLQTLKENTAPKSRGVDVSKVIQEDRNATKSYSSADTDDGETYVTESYVSLFKNKLV